MTSSSQPGALGQYLARRGFAPNPGNPTWLDHDTGQQIIRVLHEPGETTLLYCLTPRSVCLYEAVLSPGTPDAVITVAIEAALSHPTPGQPRPDQAGRRPAAHTRRKTVTAMTIDELIELAQDARGDLGGDARVRIAYQPGYPLRAALSCVTVPPGTDPSDLYGTDETAAGQQDDGTFLWLATGDLPDRENPYAPEWAWLGSYFTTEGQR